MPFKAFNGIVATVFSGYSFIGMSVISRIAKSGTQLVIGYRGSRYNEEKLRTVGDLGQVYYAKFHLKDDQSLYEAMRYSNVVINCIGKQTETRNFSFDDVHVDGPRRMARIAREAGVDKFIHISALNASPNPPAFCLKNGSQFLRSKYYGELAVREEFPDATIFRPADVLGNQDSFLNHFCAMNRSLYTGNISLWDYYDGCEKQPVFLPDLVSGIEQAVFDDSTKGKTYQAVGPYRYDFYELIEYMRSCAGQGQKLDSCSVTNLRWDPLTRVVITAFDKLSKNPWISWERVERDCVSDYVDPKLPTLTDLGVELTPLEPHIQRLCSFRPREARVEIPYESAVSIDLPRKLNVNTA